MVQLYTQKLLDIEEDFPKKLQHPIPIHFSSWDASHGLYETKLCCILMAYAPQVTLDIVKRGVGRIQKVITEGR